MRTYLHKIKENEEVIIIDIKGETDTTLRLKSMGFRKGGKIRVLKNNKYEPMIINVGQSSRLAISKGLANKIYVEKEEYFTQEEVSEMCSLLDGAIEIVCLWEAKSPSQIEWKKNWIEKARKYGAELE